jgi:hypothetical protein
LTHNYTDTAWFQEIARFASAICFTRGRVRFYNGDEIAAPTEGQVFSYFGPELDLFVQELSKVGFVVSPCSDFAKLQVQARPQRRALNRRHSEAARLFCGAEL